MKPGRGLTLSGWWQGQHHEATLGSTALPAWMLAALTEPPAKGPNKLGAKAATIDNWAGRGRDWLAVIGPGPAAGPSGEQDQREVVRGTLDAGVLKNALALAFLPRARGCYLRRQVVKKGDWTLTGRVRLALHLERGELVHAEIEGSTLNHSPIEACILEAARGVTYPRPRHRDAPAVAYLNLVFRPWSTPSTSPDGGQWDHSMDLLITPLGASGGQADPLELLEPAPPETLVPSEPTP